ncbi:MAG: dockerin type I repeat-containing protein [Sedimentisphaerales bacterium]|nr:dockerin type I repeat-containing protein [Sedimentisphaerales bacterium]
MFLTFRRLVLLFNCAVFIGSGAAQAETWLATYDASLGTFPEDQGWVYSFESKATNPWLDSGLLRMDTTVLEYLNWRYLDKYICFPADHGLVFELEVKINSSALVDIPSGRWRVGFIMLAVDHEGRSFRVGIAGNGVIMSHDSDWYYSQSTGFVPFDTTDDFHVYRLVIQNGQADLSIDGTPTLSQAVGSMNQGPTNTILFGDATYHSGCDMELTYARFGVTREPGDVNGDSTIDLTDLTTLAAHWLDTGCNCANDAEGADMDHSGVVDLIDLALLAEGWLN